jgi:hypothetical protein
MCQPTGRAGVASQLGELSPGEQELGPAERGMACQAV